MDPRARLLAIASVAFAMAVCLTGCGLTRTVVNGDPPVPAGPLGPVIPGQGGTPPVECRGVPVDQCRGFASVGDPNVVRVIVTCKTVCTPTKGDVRIDVLRPDGRTESMGEGSYAGAEAAPVPVSPPPVTSS